MSAVSTSCHLLPHLFPSFSFISSTSHLLWKRAASRSGASSSDGPRFGRFTCYHGEEEKRWHPPANEILRSIQKLYDEAARRLPLDEIPELVDCLGEVGHCFGLADPVSNIILNAIAHLSGSPPLQLQDHPPPLPRKRTRRSYSEWWGFISSTSLNGLIAFMKVYFRYLTGDQARRYLYLASYDLLLAIKLVHHDRHLPLPPSPLLPDGGKMKNALRIAALKAGHPAPDDLARTMTAQYPSHLLSPIVHKLQGSDLLTTHDVQSIKDLLLNAFQWPPPNMDFLCCPNGESCAQAAPNGTLLLATCIGRGTFARVSIEIETPNQVLSDQLRHLPDITFDRVVMETKLSKCIAKITTCSVDCEEPQEEMHYDASPPCEHIISLNMCLLDTIHCFYIRALAVLPLPGDSMRRGRLLHALIEFGYCYGPLDPVSNIIINAVWYNAYDDMAFFDGSYPQPPQEGDANDKYELQQEISDTSAMCRMASRTLDGLIALLRAITPTTTGAPLSKHEAVEYLWSRQCDLRDKLQQTVMTKKNPYAAAVKASKQQQHTMLESFLKSLSGKKLDRLHGLLKSTSNGSHCVISNADWEELNAMIKVQLTEILCRRRNRMFDCQTSTASSMKSSEYLNQQKFVRSKLEELLVAYSGQHPWEPRYKLDLICGVEEPQSYHWRCYHANFLASTHGTVLKLDGEATTTPNPVRTLFFAQFWDSQPGRFNESNSKTICCPVQVSTCFGRCTFCDEASKILHPPCLSGSYPDDGDDAVIHDYDVTDAILMYDYFWFMLDVTRLLVVLVAGSERDRISLKALFGYYGWIHTGRSIYCYHIWI
uniref:Uncharacterized protein n=2 Tax=Oryza sativa subsp. japonica TaxID=39947 RepID=Q2R964_ORYSJ|nr:hypothetical protein LOC_Os11g09820 [Oryza sativa Japonica Group]ABA91972.1 expressed protein [Oryza sativa Japonica Group]